MLAEFKIGDRVRHTAIVRLQKIGQSSNGGIFSRGILQDNSGTMNFISFEPTVADTLRECSNPCALAVYGNIDANKYATDGSLQIVIQRVESPAEDEDLSHLLPYTPKDIELYKKKLAELIKGIADSPLQKVVKTVFSDEVYHRFVKNPAAMRYHHAYLGGLLEHSVDVASLAKVMAEHIGNIDVDLVVAGALLHDIGKIREISSDIGFEYTDAGHWLGHIALGAGMVEKAMFQISELSEEQKLQLVHIIVSHHGSLEKGSPVSCVSKESFIVHYADELNATLNQFENEEKHNKWQYSRMLGRNIFTKSFDQ